METRKREGNRTPNQRNRERQNKPAGAFDGNFVSVEGKFVTADWRSFFPSRCKSLQEKDEEEEEEEEEEVKGLSNERRKERKTEEPPRAGVASGDLRRYGTPLISVPCHGIPSLSHPMALRSRPREPRGRPRKRPRGPSPQIAITWLSDQKNATQQRVRPFLCVCLAIKNES